jgi:hypothetical protein
MPTNSGLAMIAHNPDNIATAGKTARIAFRTCHFAKSLANSSSSLVSAAEAASYESALACNAVFVFFITLKVKGTIATTRTEAAVYRLKDGRGSRGVAFHAAGSFAAIAQSVLHGPTQVVEKLPCDARYPKESEEARAANGAVDAPKLYAFSHCFEAMAGVAKATVGIVIKLNEAM